MNVVVSTSSVLYQNATLKMNNVVDKIISGKAEEMIWLLEHKRIYTVGYTTYQKWHEKYGNTLIVNNLSIPVIETERGGQITFHGPGQRVCYIMVDLRKRYSSLDLSRFLDDIHNIIVETIGEFGIHGIRDNRYPGVWVQNGSKLEKIAAIGIKVRRGITYHGFALNVNNDLSFFDAIQPCGIIESNRSVTSMSSLLSHCVNLEYVDVVLQEKIKKNFKK